MKSISQLIKLMQLYGARKFYAKKLAPNDNSKNQIFLGSSFSALNVLPYQDVYTDDRDVVCSKRDRIKANICFFWVDEEGKYLAPDAQIILYPKYPEIRISGFLRGCRKAPSHVMRGRSEGRVLFLGITDQGEILGYATTSEAPLSKEVYAKDDWKTTGVFIEIPHERYLNSDTKSQLLSRLREVYEKNWIPSQKMKMDGIREPYSARNGGGYTLEAELGISPNGYAEPDYLGWEIKQYAVSNFIKYHPTSPVTLFTPEPTDGFYKESGVECFVHKFGYSDKSGKEDRINFGGIYKCNEREHTETGLKLRLDGFDEQTGKIIDVDGGVALVSRNNEIAAMWRFTSMMKHWNRKHAQAVYVPSLFRSPPPEYSYGAKILLCERTDFSLFLKALARGVIYYDPSIKCENASTSRPKIKRRSQFRIKHSDLSCIYGCCEIINLLEQS